MIKTKTKLQADATQTAQAEESDQTKPDSQNVLSSLCDSLATSQLTSTVPSERHAMYKNRGRLAMSQTDRRKKELELQKQRRFNAQQLARRLADNDWSTNDPDVGGNAVDEVDDLASVADTDETLTTEELTPDDSVESIQRKRRPGRNYRNQLMLSEWFMEIPDTLETDFLLKLCPQGKRVLVVAAKGITRTFDRRGRCIMTFPSELPGGCRQCKPGLTVLDCIWDTCSFHVLDIMHWRDMHLYDTETALRFHWLETNVAESIPNLHVRTPKNRHPFRIVQSNSCQRDSLASFLTQPPPFPLDGALFYHRESAYTFGRTPLVGWLKQYMLPEALGLPCHPQYAIGMPANYTDRLTDIEQYEATRMRLAAEYSEARHQGVQQRSPATHASIEDSKAMTE